MISEPSDEEERVNFPVEKLKYMGEGANPFGPYCDFRMEGSISIKLVS
jgi:hypothetical protein